MTNYFVPSFSLSNDILPNNGKGCQCIVDIHEVGVDWVIEYLDEIIWQYNDWSKNQPTKLKHMDKVFVGVVPPEKVNMKEWLCSLCKDTKWCLFDITI